MRRVSLGMSLAAMAALGMVSLTTPAVRPSSPTLPKVARPSDKRRKRGPSPKGKSSQKYDPSRLIADRSSSVKKLSRWHRAHPERVLNPDEKAMRRHAWYQNKLMWDALREKAGHIHA